MTSITLSWKNSSFLVSRGRKSKSYSFSCWQLRVSSKGIKALRLAPRQFLAFNSNNGLLARVVQQSPSSFLITHQMSIEAGFGFLLHLNSVFSHPACGNFQCTSFPLKGLAQTYDSSGMKTLVVYRTNGVFRHS